MRRVLTLSLLNENSINQLELMKHFNWVIFSKWVPVSNKSTELAGLSERISRDFYPVISLCASKAVYRCSFTSSLSAYCIT